MSNIPRGSSADHPTTYLEAIDEILLPHFGSWEHKSGSFYFNTNANAIALKEVKASLNQAVKEYVIGESENEMITHGRTNVAAEYRNDLRAEQRSIVDGGESE